MFLSFTPKLQKCQKWWEELPESTVSQKELSLQEGERRDGCTTAKDISDYTCWQQLISFQAS